MIKSYLKLVIIFALNHQIFLLADSIEKRLNANKQAIIKAVAQVLRTTDATDNNYDSKVLVPGSRTKTSVIKPLLRKRTSKLNYRQGLKANKPISRAGLIEPISKKNHPHLNGPGRRQKISKRQQKTIKSRKLEDEIIVTDTKDGWAWVGYDKPQLGTTTARNQYKERIRTNETLLPSRRMNYFDDNERRKPQKWVQCMDLITPRLKGYKDDWKRVEINSSHGDIRRLVHLFTENTTDHTRDEIVALLSEISNIRFRLFQWDYSAITMMLNVIIRGPGHNFRELKRGIKRMFERWHLDISMMGIFLDQSRIFRPPCINITGHSGYTKRPGGPRLVTKPDKPTRKPRDNIQSCETKETNNNKKNLRGEEEVKGHPNGTKFLLIN